MDNNKENIQHIFRPNDTIVQKVDTFISELKIKYDLIIGVHIRRSDYKTWIGGKYYYSLDEYYSFMKHYYKEMTNKKVCFFISSDENIDMRLFKGLNCYSITNGSAIEDLYSLSRCDRIMGPLSTFSRWASFYGEVPLLVLEKEDNIIADDEFSKVISLYKCENGKEFTNWTSVEEDQKNNIVR